MFILTIETRNGRLEMDRVQRFTVDGGILEARVDHGQGERLRIVLDVMRVKAQPFSGFAHRRCVCCANRLSTGLADYETMKADVAAFARWQELSRH